MIRLRDVHARVPPAALAPLTLALDPGTHALVGGKLDGPWMVLAAIAGHLRLRGGTVRVMDASPEDARVSRAIAYVPLDVALPEPLRVEEVLDFASRVRGERAQEAPARLGVLGITSLAPRAVRSLPREERRAVALAEALTCEARVILVEEPLAAIDPRAAASAADALRLRAGRGACVVIATASMRDAAAIADDVITFDRGTLVRRATSSDPLLLAGPRGAAVRVGCSDAARLAAALADEASVGASTVTRGGVVARGADAVAIARAVTRAARKADVAVESIVPDLLHDEELHASLAVGALPPAPAAPAPADEAAT